MLCRWSFSFLLIAIDVFAVIEEYKIELAKDRDMTDCFVVAVYNSLKLALSTKMLATKQKWTSAI